MSRNARQGAALQAFVDQLARLHDARACVRLLRRHREFHRPETVREIYEEMARRARADFAQAERLARCANWLARLLRDDASVAFVARAAGHVFYIRDNNHRAVACYERASRLFSRAGSDLDAGRTLSGGLQSLIYLGKYDKAARWARRAREIFARHGDRMRLARLDTNLGNVLYRQDRFAEALRCYECSLGELKRRGGPQDVAAALSNIAVCHITSGNFSAALRSYHSARAYCQAHGLTRFVIQADYNVAYLHFLRGEYTRAIELYEKARDRARSLGDRYHEALCDLDQSEMYLELNLTAEGADLSRRAFEQFDHIRMGYEAAKAQAFLAIAASREGHTTQALALFRDARRRFIAERNHVWPALIDLYQALVLYQAEDYAKARQLCRAAHRFFSQSALPSKSVVCQLLFARLDLKAGAAARAKKWSLAATRNLKSVESPALRHQAHFVRGRVEEALGHLARAKHSYYSAHMGMEGLRSQLSGEELKISFLKDKLAIYESLFWLQLGKQQNTTARERAWRYVEYAKSRGLAELISFQGSALPVLSRKNSAAVRRIRELRESLNWHYRQLDFGESGKERCSPARLRQLRTKAQEQEVRLVRAMSALRATEPEYRALQSAAIASLGDVQRVLPPVTQILEYYQARGVLFACVLSRTSLAIRSLGSAGRARELLRLLQLQLSKFRLSPDYVAESAELLHLATGEHLRELYALLIEPVRDVLTGEHLVIVPHGFLHYLPFHALQRDDRYLIDDFYISYAPSASVYSLCCSKTTVQGRHSLVLGIPDPLAPRIKDEVEGVASFLQSPKLFIGQAATEDCLRKFGPRSRFVHIATHGIFRQDNPMFSSLRLGKGQLTLFDLYGLRLPAELVTLSGCGTGLNVVVGGDELLGLIRGLLYAGARSLLVTLWDVNDQSTAEFMKLFYRSLSQGMEKVEALRHAMVEIRRSRPHPYFWALFALIGRASNGRPRA